MPQLESPGAPMKDTHEATKTPCAATKTQHSQINRYIQRYLLFKMFIIVSLRLFVNLNHLLLSALYHSSFPNPED